MPYITNLRLDPFERTGWPNNGTKEGAQQYFDWFKYQFWRFVFVQQVVGKELQTFLDYPPMQRGASFNLDAVKAEMAKRMAEAEAASQRPWPVIKLQTESGGNEAARLNFPRKLSATIIDQRIAFLENPEVRMNFATTKTGLAQTTERSPEGMVYIPGGTFRMGSDRHYPEEAPVHRVTVDGFWMDRTPVTNRQFREFINATGYATFAELVPNAKIIPVRCPYAQGRLTGVHATQGSFGPALLGRVVDVRVRRQLAPALRPPQQHPRAGRASCRSRRLLRCRSLCQMGRQGIADRSRMGVRGARRIEDAEFAWGGELTPGGKHMANTWQGGFPARESCSRRF